MRKDRPIRVLIVDDHALVRKGMRLLLLQAKDIVVVGEAENGQGALQRMAQLQADVIIMDLPNPSESEVEAIRHLTSMYPSLRILLVTGAVEENAILSAVREGAHGYLPKDADLDSCLEAIRTVFRGEVVVPSPWVQKLLTYATTKKRQALQNEKLTQREVEILRLLAGGLEDREIAAELSISQGTVRTHVSNLLRKLNCKNRVEATRWALRHGIASLDSTPTMAPSPRI